MTRAADLRFVLVHVALSRAIYLGVGVTTALLIEASGTVRLADLVGPAGDALRGLLVHGDSYWYRTIIEDGYAAIPFSADAQQNWAFFPLYPAVVAALGGSHLAGILVANVAAVAATHLLLAEVRAGWGRTVARWTVLFLLYWPFSGMLSSFRPESLMLLFVVGAWVAGRRGSWWVAWSCVALATLTRSQGLLVALVLIDPLWAQRDAIRQRPWPVLVGAALPLLAVAGFSAYLGALTGDPLAWAHIQVAWGRAGFDPLGLLAAYWPPLFIRYGWDFSLVNWLIIGSVVAIAVVHVRLRAPGLAVFAVAWTVGAAVFGALTTSMGRYVSTLFPVPLALAASRRLRPHRVAVLGLFIAGLASVGAWTGLGIRAVLP